MLYRGYSKVRTRTAPRKVLCSYAQTYRRALRRCVSLISSNPCTQKLRGHFLPPDARHRRDRLVYRELESVAIFTKRPRHTHTKEIIIRTHHDSSSNTYR